MLIDDYLKEYTFNEHHEVLVGAHQKTVYRTLREIDFTDSRIINFLFKLRGFKVKDGTLQGFIENDFILLEEREPQEIVLGFMAAESNLKKVSAAEFIKALKDNPRGVLGVWNFHLQQEEGNRVRLSTETRVLCTGRLVKIIFSIYWFFISSFSKWIRRIILKMIKSKAEAVKH